MQCWLVSATAVLLQQNAAVSSTPHPVPPALPHFSPCSCDEALGCFLLQQAQHLLAPLVLPPHLPAPPTHPLTHAAARRPSAASCCSDQQPLKPCSTCLLLTCTFPAAAMRRSAASCCSNDPQALLTLLNLPASSLLPSPQLRRGARLLPAAADAAICGGRCGSHARP